MGRTAGLMVGLMALAAATCHFFSLEVAAHARDLRGLRINTVRVVYSVDDHQQIRTCALKLIRLRATYANSAFASPLLASVRCLRMTVPPLLSAEPDPLSPRSYVAALSILLTDPTAAKLTSYITSGVTSSMLETTLGPIALTYLYVVHPPTSHGSP